MKLNKIPLAAALAAAVIFSQSSCESQATQWVTKEQDEKTAEISETQDETQDEKQQNTEDGEKDKILESIMIYICGAVAQPGVYELPAGARVIQAVEAAGGLAENADEISVNQAKKLEDGEQIRIYTKEEAQAMPAGGNTGGDLAEAKVNINTADEQTLMTLPGIGQAKASDIVKYRTENGRFGTIEDIMKITGIKEAVFSKIQDKIAVG